MKSHFLGLLAVGLTCATSAWSQNATYTNFIRQYQYPTGLSYDASVASVGKELSQLAIDPGGARFELWTVSSDGPSSYLLDSSYVGVYIPLATVNIRSEDTSATILRTRADRPFYVDLTVSGLLSTDTDPEPSKSVNFYHHVQSYGAGGTDAGIDRTQATLLTQSSITTNGTQNLTFEINQVPGADRSKVRGEERFSVYSLKDYQAPASQISSKFIQIWPVADGSIAGVTNNQKIRYALPTLTVTMNDLYPLSITTLQAYKGDPVLGTTGVGIRSWICPDGSPKNEVWTVNDKDLSTVFTSDGRWTLELITKTPFGIDRLAYVSFDVDRTMKVNGAVTTIE